MRKFLVTAAFAVTMALGAVVSLVAAQPTEQANCRGEEFGVTAPENGVFLGQFISFIAQQNDGLGAYGRIASSDCGSR